MRREPYREPGRRARNEYRLTEKGLELFPALLALLQWGDRWTADPSGPAVTLDRWAGVETDASRREIVLAGELEDPLGQLDGCIAVLAAHHDGVADRLDDVAAELGCKAADVLVEGHREVRRAVVSVLGCEPGEADEVGKQEGVESEHHDRRAACVCRIRSTAPTGDV